MTDRGLSNELLWKVVEYFEKKTHESLRNEVWNGLAGDPSSSSSIDAHMEILQRLS